MAGESNNRGWRLELTWIPGEFAVCRLASGAPLPAWASLEGAFQSVTRTSAELSIICAAYHVPASVECTRGWRLARVDGTFPHDATGVLASVVVPLGHAGISVLACATFDTDYILVRETQLSEATGALLAAGHSVRGS